MSETKYSIKLFDAELTNKIDLTNSTEFVKGKNFDKFWRNCGKKFKGKKIPDKNIEMILIKKFITSPILYIITIAAEINPSAIKGIEEKINTPKNKGNCSIEMSKSKKIIDMDI